MSDALNSWKAPRAASSEQTQSEAPTHQPFFFPSFLVAPRFFSQSMVPMLNNACPPSGWWSSAEPSVQNSTRLSLNKQMATMLESAWTPARPNRNKDMVAMQKSGQTPLARGRSQKDMHLCKHLVLVTAEEMIETSNLFGQCCWLRWAEELDIITCSDGRFHALKWTFFFACLWPQMDP